MKRFVMGVLAMCAISPLVWGNGYGVARAPVNGCSSCVQGSFAIPQSTIIQREVIQPPPLVRQVTTYEEIQQAPIVRDTVIQQAPVILRQPAIYSNFQANVFRAPVLRAPCGYGGCGVGAAFNTGYGFNTGFGVNVRTRGVNVNTGFGGTFVRAGGTVVNTGGFGQSVDVRRGGLRGVLFGTRVRIR